MEPTAIENNLLLFHKDVTRGKTAMDQLIGMKLVDSLGQFKSQAYKLILLGEHVNLPVEGNLVVSFNDVDDLALIEV
jgi:hypothetical protein